eukprot:10403700-Alexandrium_andersonii.AAC.1
MRWLALRDRLPRRRRRPRQEQGRPEGGQVRDVDRRSSRAAAQARQARSGLGGREHSGHS